MPGMNEHRVRKVKTVGTTSYQLGRYEMSGNPGYRRSVFKVLVHLGEHPTPDDALAVWPGEIDHLRRVGREGKADKLAGKLERLRALS